jgi:ABC-type uncharacterized transport system
MAPSRHPISFSRGRRWGIFFSVMTSIAAMAALVVMLNYLGARHFLRFYWSTKTSQPLSPATLSLLDSITNDVKVILYYDKSDGLYDDISDLLKQYHFHNSRITVQTVDYDSDSSAAVRVRDKYGLGSQKNVIIYDCNDHVTITMGDSLADYAIEQTQPADSQPGLGEQSKPMFDKHTTVFNGEGRVDADLISVTGPLLKACYLSGNGEPPLEPSGGVNYSGFVTALSNSHIQTTNLYLTGTNVIPADCNLLVIAGPREKLRPEELKKIRDYLAQGGRLFVLFNGYDIDPVDTGLESILADWGVQVNKDSIEDRDNMVKRDVMEISSFNPNHPCVSSLDGSLLYLCPPRSLTTNTQKVATGGSDPPSVVGLAATGPRIIEHINGSAVSDNRRACVIAAVEKKNVQGVQDRGTTRIIVAGDSYFLATGNIDQGQNAEFAELAARWLLEKNQLLTGVAPRKVVDFKVMLTSAQLISIRWILLGAMPGGILAFGGLVWLRRRH